eukprot:UN30362
MHGFAQWTALNLPNTATNQVHWSTSEFFADGCEGWEVQPNRWMCEADAGSMNDLDNCTVPMHLMEDETIDSNGNMVEGPPGIADVYRVRCLPGPVWCCDQWDESCYNTPQWENADFPCNTHTETCQDECELYGHTPLDEGCINCCRDHYHDVDYPDIPGQTSWMCIINRDANEQSPNIPSNDSENVAEQSRNLPSNDSENVEIVVIKRTITPEGFTFRYQFPDNPDSLLNTWQICWSLTKIGFQLDADEVYNGYDN